MKDSIGRGRDNGGRGRIVVMVSIVLGPSSVGSDERTLVEADVFGSIGRHVSRRKAGDDEAE